MKPCCNSSVSFSALLLLVFCFTSAAGQMDKTANSSKLRIGPSVAGLGNRQSGVVQHLGFIFQLPHIPTFTDTVGTGLGFSAGVAFDYSFGERFGLRSHFSYTFYSASWYTRLPGIAVLNPIEGMPSQFYKEAVAETHYSSLGIDLLADIRLLRIGPGKLSLAIGPSVERTLGLTESRRVQFHDGIPYTFSMPGFPDSLYSFPDTVYSVNKSVGNAAPLRVAAGGGLFYDYPVTDRFTLSSGLFFSYGLTPLVAGSDWQLDHISARISLLMQL